MSYHRIFRLEQFLTSFFLAMLVILSIVSCAPFISSPWLHYESEYDDFRSLTRTLESNKKYFSIGDEIVLTARIISDRPVKIRMYKDRRKSFAIRIRRWLKNDIDFTDNDYIRGFPPTTQNDQIEVIYIKPDNPFQFKVKGVFEKRKSGAYIFNFGKFGRFEKQKLGEFSLGSEWRDLDPMPAQEMEEIYTNRLIINVDSI